jgi:hypothetical protein
MSSTLRRTEEAQRAEGLQHREGREPGAPGTRRPPSYFHVEKQAQISVAALQLVPPSVTTFNGAVVAVLLDNQRFYGAGAP